MAPAELGEPDRQQRDVARPRPACVARFVRLCRTREIRHAAHGEPGDFRRGIPARRASGLRSPGVSLGKMGPGLRLLRREGRAAPSRARRPEKSWRVEQDLESDALVRTVQQGEGGDDGGGIRTPRDSGQSEGAAQGRRRCELDPVGTLRAAQKHGPSRRMRDGREDEIQPDAARVTEGALD